MGRKKSSVVTKPQFRPFCYYCERDFDNEKVLIQHQKLKHFQCYFCHRKSDTARGLVGHMLQVHKESMHKVPNAIPGRDDPELSIHGIDGVPNHLVAARAKGTAYEDELSRKRALEHAEHIAQSYPATFSLGHPMVPPYFPMSIPPPPPPPIGMLQHAHFASFSGFVHPPPPPPPTHSSNRSSAIPPAISSKEEKTDTHQNQAKYVT